MGPGYRVHRRSYRSCLDDGRTYGDLCWFSQSGKLADSVNLMLNGRSTRIASDDAGGWRMVNDDGWKVEQRTGGSNDTVWNEWWLLTDPQGIQYTFGRNRQAAQIVPAHGADAMEPCSGQAWQATGCYHVYRWNLESVVDPRGNTMNLYYARTTGKYGASNNTTTRLYDVNAFLDRIEYGTRSDSAEPASARVRFGVAARCSAAACSVDVPWDRWCDPSATSCPHLTSPAFWMQWRLATVTTEVRNITGAYVGVDKWDLTHTFPDPGDGTTPNLWLQTIRHTGLVGGTATEPAVNYGGGAFANTAEAGIPAHRRFRLGGITSGSGEQVIIYYSGPDCTTPLPAGLSREVCRSEVCQDRPA